MHNEYWDRIYITPFLDGQNPNSFAVLSVGKLRFLLSFEHDARNPRGILIRHVNYLKSSVNCFTCFGIVFPDLRDAVLGSDHKLFIVVGDC